jgi:hypothetical protein
MESKLAGRTAARLLNFGQIGGAGVAATVLHLPLRQPKHLRS